MEEIKAFLRSRQPVNLIIVLANILVFLVLSFLGDTESASFMAAHGASVTAYVEQGEYYRLFTCMFMHFGLEHLFYNMLVLIFLGDALEEAVGKVLYLVIYLGGGLIGNIDSGRSAKGRVGCIGGSVRCHFCGDRCACIYCTEKPRQSRHVLRKTAGADGSALDHAEYDGDRSGQQRTHWRICSWVCAGISSWSGEKGGCAYRFC